MTEIALSCPHCGFSRQVELSRIPPGTTRAGCPRCRRKFELNPVEYAVAIPSPPASPEAKPAPAALPEPGPDSPASAPPEPESLRRIPFVFTGTARDYFGIWIVNTLLKIVTLGLYSPWAKVRKRQFFYANTLLEEVSFDYLANPLSLLKGWLIGAGFFLLYSVGSQFSPALSVVLGLVIFLLVPWIIVRSRLFNNRNSAHRNVRFNFHPDYREAYTAYAWLPILTPFTLGLLTPYAYFRQKRFLVNNNRYGTTPFSMDATAGSFYGVFLRAGGVVLLMAVCGGALTAVFVPSLMSPASPAMAPALAFAIPAVLTAGYLLAGLYLYVRMSNLVWNGTVFDGHRFVSTLRVREMAWIFLSNAVAIAASFGMLIPWASVRLARYRLDRLALEVRGSLDRYRSDRRSEVGAAGEEIGDIFGVDIGL